VLGVVVVVVVVAAVWRTRLTAATCSVAGAARRQARKRVP
jgi:hypothetical protein